MADGTYKQIGIFTDGIAANAWLKQNLLSIAWNNDDKQFQRLRFIKMQQMLECVVSFDGSGANLRGFVR